MYLLPEGTPKVCAWARRAAMDFYELEMRNEKYRVIYTYESVCRKKLGIFNYFDNLFVLFFP